MRVVAGDAIGNGAGVAAVDFFRISAEGFDERRAIHDEGFHEDDGALVESIGEEITGPEVGVLGEVFRSPRVPRVTVRRERDEFVEGGRDFAGEGDFFFDGAGEKALEHLESFVFVRDFSGGVGTVEDDVEVLEEFGSFGGGAVEVEADDEVGLDGFVDELCARPDLRSAVEEAGVGEAGGAFFGDGFEPIANEGDGGTLGFEHGGEKLGGGESHGAFTDGDVIPFELAGLDVGVVSADVAGVEGDVESG